jgi:hypothetical protein
MTQEYVISYDMLQKRQISSEMRRLLCDMLVRTDMVLRVEDTGIIGSALCPGLVRGVLYGVKTPISISQSYEYQTRFADRVISTVDCILQINTTSIAL